MRLSMLIAPGDMPLILVVPCCVSVVSSRVIVAHILWMRKRFESRVIVTNCHRLDSISRQFCVYYMCCFGCSGCSTLLFVVVVFLCVRLFGVVPFSLKTLVPRESLRVVVHRESRGAYLSNPWTKSSSYKQS